MPADVQKLIQSLVKSQHLQAQRDTRRPHRTVVTISRDAGAGGGEIASRLAHAFGVDIWDREILDAVAEKAHSDPGLMARLDDRVRTGRETWIYSLLSGQNAFMTSYRHHLVNVALAIAEQGGVIIGRGVHLILANRPVFRLRITGSPDLCAKRLMERERIDYEAALAKVKRVNKEREDFVRNAFRQRLDESARFDLIVNTDKYGQRWDELSEVLVRAIRLTGLDDPSGGTGE